MARSRSGARPKAVLPPTGRALEAIRRQFVEPTQCTDCGHIDELDCYDVGGLDDGDLYCNRCGHIGPMRDLADYSYRGEPS